MLKKSQTTISGFRFMRCLSADHNARRFRTHIERLGRTPELRRELRSSKLKARLQKVRRIAVARTQGSNGAAMPGRSPAID